MRVGRHRCGQRTSAPASVDRESHVRRISASGLLKRLSTEKKWETIGLRSLRMLTTYCIRKGDETVQVRERCEKALAATRRGHTREVMRFRKIKRLPRPTPIIHAEPKFSTPIADKVDEQDTLPVPEPTPRVQHTFC